MSSFGLYLASVSVPIAQRVLTGLGVGVVAYVGLDLVMTQIRDMVLSNYGALSMPVQQLLGLSGVPTAIGIILGAFAARFSMLQLKALSQVA